ncbi:hypothetical protein E5288_WYG020501 [Bos mutus]|uniref:Uncharacterized protein n=1 Tax=Bos mutus TaxID=72004 RepID=A0A6B0S3Y5_9CETA|nr:hypothetical protein [Bos mutus]
MSVENGKPTSQIKVKDTRKAREVRAERLESEGLGPILNLTPAVGRKKLKATSHQRPQNADTTCTKDFFLYINSRGRYNHFMQCKQLRPSRFGRPGNLVVPALFQNRRGKQQ